MPGRGRVSDVAAGWRGRPGTCQPTRRLVQGGILLLDELISLVFLMDDDDHRAWRDNSGQPASLEAL